MTIQGSDAWSSREMAAAIAFAHALFRKPSPDQHAWLLSAECRDIWNEIAGSSEGLPLRLEVPEDYDDYCERFIATFDVGTPAPPVPLIESHYNKREPVPKILHENILFYRQFGLQLRDSSLESADHLRHQLEFVQHLLEYHARLTETHHSTEAQQALQALYDYANRHLQSWLPEAATCAVDAPLQFAHPVLMLTNRLVQRLAADARDALQEANSVPLKEALPCSD